MKTELSKEEIKNIIEAGIKDCWDAASSIMDSDFDDILGIVEETFRQPIHDLTPMGIIIWFTQKETEFEWKAKMDGHDNIHPRVYTLPILLSILNNSPEVNEIWTEIYKPKKGGPI